jgi:hypothetical protein
LEALSSGISLSSALQGIPKLRIPFILLQLIKCLTVILSVQSGFQP